MYPLATMHSVTDRRTDRQADDIVMSQYRAVRSAKTCIIVSLLSAFYSLFCDDSCIINVFKFTNFVLFALYTLFYCISALSATFSCFLFIYIILCDTGAIDTCLGL